MPKFFVVTEEGSCAARRLAMVPSTKQFIEGQWLSGKVVEPKTIRSVLAHCDQRGETDPAASLPFRLFYQERVSVREYPGTPWEEVRGNSDAKTRQMIMGLVQYQPKKIWLPSEPSEPLTIPMVQQPA